ncbi:MAG: hypothetical protein SFT94_09590 [Pseudanabaenaceae cyanobacterium bins.68]|nr:hypothetical protein [Pseudanabaenaceae cyanobacterium bins.68]
MSVDLDPQQTIQQLRQQLEQRDLLVQQLSQELFRLVQQPAPSPDQTILHQELSQARTQLEAQQQEILELRQLNTQLSDRQQELEQMVAELPNVYQSKFAERMVQIKQKVELLQRENRQLHIELQSVNYRLATRSRPQKIELPNVQPLTPVHG